ncbi:YdcF family protein [Thiorhodococcus mannitoliphagus]|uniref:YdcF family protein n=1 Tax=Thiorhodococcus mannitoliphagus TaxID=329406 RepID=A0A6P1DS51_9GAMM|nr:YdcF family protein [Thiorhodococcus mannitoliphagus]NEX20888.1 YdcF family protein [Thiorhodococcus mannitoliphagus]
MLYSIIKSFLIPPGVIILMLALALWLRHGVAARLLTFVAFTTLTLLCLPVIATSLMGPLEPYPAINLEAVPASAEAILILGAGRRTDAPEYGGDTLDDFSLRRVRYGALLHRATGLPVYVTGGRLHDEGAPVGRLMAEVLISEYGIPVAAAETESRTTWENATLTAPLLAQNGIHNVLLVSDAWHLPRAVAIFEQVGLRVTPAPTAFVHRPDWGEDMSYADWLPSIKAFSTSAYAIHEHLGRLWYQLRAWTQGVSPPEQVAG